MFLRDTILHASNKIIIPQRIKLVAPVVHDPSEPGVKGFGF